MIIGIPKELVSEDPRAPIIPETVKKLCALGAELIIEKGCGESISFTNEDYQIAGAKILTDRNELLAGSDIIMRLHKPPIEEISRLKKDCIHISYLSPFNDHNLVDAFCEAEVISISMDLIPRITRAQKMDALSSQANLAGYAAVILAAEKLDRILPMMTTAAGTILPTKVFVIGVGVAGLQAIATAKRLGARVEAFDSRTVVSEQVKSLGAKFINIDIGETGQTAEGHAVELTDKQIEMQRKGMKEIMSQADIVITTAQIFGKSAPRIVTRDMVEEMKPGSIIVDMAVETGGNVEGSVAGNDVNMGNGVTIFGPTNLPGRVGKHSSQMYSTNLMNLVSEFWDTEINQLVLNPDDEIIRNCMITRDGKLVNEHIIKNRQLKS